MFKKLSGVLAGLLLFGSVCIADDADLVSSTGHVKDFHNKFYKEVVWFSIYDVGGSTGTAYDYNESQGCRQLVSFRQLREISGELVQAPAVSGQGGRRHAFPFDF